MDVFRQLGDAVGDLYSTNYTNDHALNSPDLSVYAMSPTSIFMYEHDNEPIPLTKTSTDNMNIRGDSSNPLFDAPWSEEMTDLGCSIGDSFLSDSSFCGSSLNDSVKDAVWDFLGYDDVSSPLQHPDDDFIHSPTLAELNMEDTHSFDIYSGGPGQPPSAFSQQPVQAKTKPVLIKQNSQRHRPQDFTKKVQASSHDKYSSLFTLSKSHPTQSNQHKTTQMIQSQSLNQVKTECPKPSKFSSSQSLHTSSLSTNCLSFSNLFGQRTRTFASSHQAKDQDKVVVKRETVEANDDSSMDRKWEEIKNFIHEDTVCKMKQEEYDDFEDEAVSSPTKLTFKKHAHGYSVKSEKTEVHGSRKRTESASSGFESHDEGLGSEHEIEDGTDDEGDAGQEEGSDMSDLEDDTGVASSSLSIQTGKYTRGKSRRSEYDDMTPNPKKLLHIGNELRKLNKIISDMAPVSELSGSARNRCRKEKNKLASRACRLKKKAQHEANKIKLSGLDNEHTRLLFVLTAIKKDMVHRVQKRESKYNASLNHRLDNLIKTNLGQMVAGHTNEYVNMVMERTAREKSNATKEK